MQSFTAPCAALFAAAFSTLCICDGYATAQPRDEFPAEFYYEPSGSPKRIEHRSLEGSPAPTVMVEQWIGDAVSPASLKGRVVVVDFWATWCGPCMRSIPHNNEMVHTYADQGLVFVGIHDARRGWDKAAQTVETKAIAYSVGLDAGGQSASAWKVGFWPTYGVIDRSGTLRALGLRPEAVEPVVQKLLAEPGPKSSRPGAEPRDGTGAAEVPSQWLEGSASTRRRLEPLLTAAVPPPLQISRWINDKNPGALAEHSGKVVLLLFGSAAGASSTLMAKCNQLHEQHQQEGLVVIGVMYPTAPERATDVVHRLGLGYFVGVDSSDKKTISAYKVDGAPDCYLIDRAGRLRVADVKDHVVSEAVAMLLAEPPPPKAGKPGKDAPRTSKKAS